MLEKVINTLELIEAYVITNYIVFGEMRTKWQKQIIWTKESGGSKNNHLLNLDVRCGRNHVQLRLRIFLADICNCTTHLFFNAISANCCCSRDVDSCSQFGNNIMEVGSIPQSLHFDKNRYYSTIFMLP